MRQRLRLFAAVLAAVTLSACGDDRDTPTSPTRPGESPGPFVGVWSGSITDEAGSRVLRLTIVEQIDRTLLGNWAATFQDGSADDGGAASGLLNAAANAVFLTMTSSRSCPSSTAPRSIAGNLTIDGNRMNGSALDFGCNLRSAIVDLSKQQ